MGSFLGKWGSLGFPVPGDGQFTNPQGIAVASNGSVYVADTNNLRIQRFDADGNFEDKWSIEQPEGGLPCLPMGIAVAPDGSTVYVADANNHRVLRFDAEGTFLSEWGTSAPSSGSDNGEFNEPSGIDVDSEGRVFVADTRNHRIQYFDAVGAFLGKWGSEGTFDGGVRVPPRCGHPSELRHLHHRDTMNNRIQARRPIV